MLDLALFVILTIHLEKQIRWLYIAPVCYLQIVTWMVHLPERLQTLNNWETHHSRKLAHVHYSLATIKMDTFRR